MSIHARKDVDPNDGIRKYGKVAFADPVNNRYPIDTPERIRIAWALVHIPENAAHYSFDELEEIRSRILDAAAQHNMELSTETVERDARLFTAGDYPDKGIAVSESDIDRMVEFHKPVPIKIEHTDTPLDLGTVTKLWRVRRDLFGRLSFTSPAWGLLVSSGARRLSAAIKRDKTGITEVSLVKHPRIADAVVFSEDEVDFTIDEKGDDMSNTQVEEFSRKISDLERQIAAKEVDGRIDTLKRAGKLAPAAENFARALLLAAGSQVVTFADGEEKPVADTFMAFLEAQPKVVEFSETATGSTEAELSDSEREMCAKLGISPDAVIKHRAR